MERLSDTAIEIINDLHTERLEYASEYIPLIDAANKLAEYEDLEEQGLLLRLPCKIGDTVYEVQELRKRIRPYTIISIHVSRCSVLFGWEIKDSEGIYSNTNGFCDYAIGKTVFLTEEEAKAKLKELEGSEDK